MNFKNFVDNKKISLLQEMAQRMDIIKRPIKTDKETIQFLQQFPAHYWPQALAMRMNRDLFNALHQREKLRQPIEEKVKNLLKHFFSGDLSVDDLKGQVSDKLYERLKSGDYDNFKKDKKSSQDAAEKIAEFEAEKAVPNVQEPKDQYQKYTFKNGTKSETYLARPFLNRLVHKLERDYGQEHYEGSELKDFGTTHGEYGYDLGKPQKGIHGLPHSTRGMPLPMEKQTRQRAAEFLNHNFHRMYGNLPESELKNGKKITWKPVSQGVISLEDNWTVRKERNRLYSKWVNKLKNEEKVTLPDGTEITPSKIANRSQYEKIARQLADKELVEKIQEGQLRTPPVPGLYPQGLPFKVKTNSDGTKTIQAPPLFLPFTKRKVHKLVNGKPQQVEEDVPVVKPMEYLRELGTEEGDENIPDEQKTGLNKDYVIVPHDKYKKQAGYIAGGGLHPNQNADERMYLGEGDPEYLATKEKVFNDMKTTQKDGNTYYKDLLSGIKNCIKSGCGGITSYEANILNNSLHDLHSMVVLKVLMNLRNPNLLTNTGRMKYAKNIITSWAQQNLEGGGTRRRRWLVPSARPTSIHGGKEDEPSIAQSIATDDSEKDKGLAKKVHGLVDKGIGPGGRKRATGEGQFAYHVDNLRKLISELSGEAKNVDQKIINARQAGLHTASDELINLYSGAITDRVQALSKLTDVLKALYTYEGLPENKAEEKAQGKINLYSQGDRSVEQIMNGFRNNPSNQKVLSDLEIIKQKTDQGKQPEFQMVNAYDEDIKNFKAIVDQLVKQNLDFKNPLVRKNLEDYVAQREDEPELHTKLKQILDDLYQKVDQQSAIAAKTVNTIHPPVDNDEARARSLSTAIANSKDKFLHDEMLELSKNPYFLEKVPVTVMKSLIEKMKLAVSERPDLAKKYGNAMMRLITKADERGI